MCYIQCMNSKAGESYAWVWSDSDSDICYEVIFRHGQVLTQVWLGYDIVA